MKKFLLGLVFVFSLSAGGLLIAQTKMENNRVPYEKNSTFERRDMDCYYPAENCTKTGY